MGNAEFDKSQELAYLLGLVKDYPFNNLYERFGFRANLPLSETDFEQSGVNSDVLSSINSALQTKDVAMFVSHLKMGTTSLGRAWVAQNPEVRNEVSMLDSKNRNIQIVHQRFPGNELFIDELTTDNDDLNLIDGLLAEGRNLLIRPHLTSVDLYRSRLKQKQIDFTEIPLLPLQADKMQGYLATRFSLDANDPFVKFVTELSGGSLRVANEVTSKFSYKLRGGDGSVQRNDVLNILNSSYDNLRMYFQGINDGRNKLSDELKTYLPNPALQRLKEGPMDVIRI